ASTDLRGEALLALGKMKVNRATSVLRQHTTDPDQFVVLRAWAAIGLLDSPEAAVLLQTIPGSSTFDRIGWTIAVGLATNLDQSVVQTLQTQMEESVASAEAKRLAVWALR